MMVSGQIYAPGALPPGKDVRVIHLDITLAGLCGRCCSTGNRTQVIQLLARCSTALAGTQPSDEFVRFALLTN
jgi:hypothetical protein